MKVFRLFVQNVNKWELVCTVESTDPKTAQQEAVQLLKPQDRGKPLKLVEDGQPAPT